MAAAKKLGLPSDDGHLRTMLMLADVATRHGRYDRALAMLLGLVLVRPDHAPLYEALGGLYQSTGRAAEALACYEEAAQLDPESPFKVALLRAGRAR